MKRERRFGCWEGLLSSTLLDNFHDEYDVAQNNNCKLHVFSLTVKGVVFNDNLFSSPLHHNPTLPCFDPPIMPIHVCFSGDFEAVKGKMQIIPFNFGIFHLTPQTLNFCN